MEGVNRYRYAIPHPIDTPISIFDMLLSGGRSLGNKTLEGINLSAMGKDNHVKEKTLCDTKG